MKKLRLVMLGCAWLIFLAGVEGNIATGGEPLVIAGSPSLRQPLEALAQAFEAAHPGVKVKLYLGTGLEIRQTVAAMENSPVGQYFIGSEQNFIGKGPIHIIAPGGDELISRLQTRYYVLPGGARPYAREYLVLVVPEQLAEAPTSFAGIQGAVKRLAVADPDRTVLGRQTRDVLRSLNFRGQLDVATDARGVLDHLLSGEADAGIIFGHDAVKEQERVRVAAVAEEGYEPTVHSMAMERFCPNRKLCEDFLAFAQSGDARKILAGFGYLAPAGR